MSMTRMGMALGAADPDGVWVAAAAALDVTAEQLRSRAAALGVTFDRNRPGEPPSLHGHGADDAHLFLIDVVDIGGDGARKELGQFASLRELLGSGPDEPCTHLARLFVDHDVARLAQVELARIALAQLAAIFDWAVDVGLRDGETSTEAFHFASHERRVFARGADALRVLVTRADSV
jgi:hypothetical protein